MTATAILLNIAVLWILLKEKSPRTPFNVYILVMTFSHLLYLALTQLMTILTIRYTNWLLHPPVCTLHLYCRYVIVVITVHNHGIITLNRLWALFWPHSYRQHHTYTVAWLICFTMVVYVHVISLPGIILDAVYYRPPGSVCRINAAAQHGWTIFTEIVAFDVPKLFVPLCYPLLLWKFGNTIHDQSYNRIYEQKLDYHAIPLYKYPSFKRNVLILKENGAVAYCSTHSESTSS
ncbi:uncharacterized protein LOC129601362 [Paramacrobiotus metropolitanus]|uniref:uncharacterized protein LOC129601362 n=1 Tax=Paramacrobiotus metropolitanus TaxID=2943436 RepID=UPI002445AFE5|nr:uncharacterized protein LOC129601362 [Paramacrobiotus metropolitanus]